MPFQLLTFTFFQVRQYFSSGPHVSPWKTRNEQHCLYNSEAHLQPHEMLGQRHTQVFFQFPPTIFTPKAFLVESVCLKCHTVGLSRRQHFYLPLCIYYHTHHHCSASKLHASVGWVNGIQLDRGLCCPPPCPLWHSIYGWMSFLMPTTL